MSIVVNRTTKEVLYSVHTPDYPASNWIINPDLSAVKNVPPQYWKIVGDRIEEMNPDEKEIADKQLLDSDKAAKIRNFGLQAIDVLDTHYNSAIRDGLASLKLDALTSVPPKVNRIKYIQSAIDWCFSVQAAFERAKAEVMSMKTREQVADAVFDLSHIEAADPMVTLAGAISIKD